MSTLVVDKIENSSQLVIEIADTEALTLTAARAARLQDMADLTPTDGNIIVGDGSSWVAESGATARTSLGLGTIATQNANNVAITGGSIAGITDLAVADGGTGASTAAGARTNIGIDGSSGVIDVGDLAAAVLALFIPVGLISPYAGTTAPSGWELCYGQALSRTTESALFDVIGTTYGSGDGSTTFNVPDLRGYVVAGQDDMGGTSANRLTGLTNGINGDTLGATGGAESHTLTQAQTPLKSHSHTEHADNPSAEPPVNPDTFRVRGFLERSDSLDNSGTSNTTAAASDATATAHNNVQPTIILNYIIKK